MSAASSPRLAVFKFGGTSLGSAERIAAVAEIIRRQSALSQVVVVVSAMGGVTEDLLRAAAAASRHETEVWQQLGERIRGAHLGVCHELLGADERVLVEAAVAASMGTFADFCSGFSLVSEVTPRSLDSLSSLGEVLAAALVAAVLRTAGVAAEAVDATEVIVSDDHFGNASPLLDPTRQRIAERIIPRLLAGRVPIVTGFRAATADGLCTTLGRGGSDYSATILGALLPADEVWIWTDVDGILTADPRLVASAHVLPEVSYREAIELSFFGAKVLHPKSIELPMRTGIPVWIKNTFRPEAQGTRISHTEGGRPGVRAVAHTAEAHLFTVSGADGFSFTRLAAAVFNALEAERVTTLIVTQSSAENVICFAVNSREAPRVQRRLERERGLAGSAVLSVEAMPKVGIVVAVGEAMKGTPGIAARLFGALGGHGINVRAISQGSSELSVSAAVQASDLPAAVSAIHEEFSL
ncbi:MAG: aspartate kinase [Candidatus Dormibacteria bacterium]